jgi:hypothetical protein
MLVFSSTQCRCNVESDVNGISRCDVYESTALRYKVDPLCAAANSTCVHGAFAFLDPAQLDFNSWDPVRSYQDVYVFGAAAI